MAGMSLGMERTFGYDDTYVASEKAKELYPLLWYNNAALGKYLRMDSRTVVISPPATYIIQQAVDLTTETINKARGKDDNYDGAV